MIVIKLGGAALYHTLNEPALFETLASVQEPLVLVHGGGPDVNNVCEKMGLKATFVDGQRVTTPETMEVVAMVLKGKINTALVRGLENTGRTAVGLSGVDLNLFSCVEENPALGRVGRVSKVNHEALRPFLKNQWIPVIAPLRQESKKTKSLRRSERISPKPRKTGA